ncbi:SDR family oxidoreductase [Uliginosibacterium gangwonense]|uniref:SDR family oxidoreductase n=1 Tax=Uliginosibacterium gangwonense TaxID=392736 RepID=UPI000380F3E3|nr:SDR family oxidoreductase [Uliginosibacterium gangwonense]
MNLQGSKILVLGASGGIGSAVAYELAKAGAALTLVGRQRESLKRLAKTLEQEVASVNILTGDLVADAPGVAQAAIRAATGIDMLINCAGMQVFGFSNDEQPQDTARLFATNVIGPIQLTNALLPHMLERRQGRIVHVGSIFGSIGFPCFASYSASKFALRGYSEALRRELVGTGVSVHYVAPRYTRTSFNQDAVARMAVALKMAQDDPADVAGQVLAAISSDRADTYLGWPEKLFVRLNALLPRLVDQSLMKQVAQMRPFARLNANRQTP